MFEFIIPSELPPRPPKTFFGRNKLVDKIVDLAKNLTPLALIGPGGIGKTSVALTVLHNDRIKQRFGHNRRIIRCDHFPPSLSNFLHRLSAVTGAGVANPNSLADLRPFLSSKDMLIVLESAESILDPRGPDAREIYAVVEELGRFDNICLCITSRDTTIPPDCKTFNVPKLSMEAARDTFHRIYMNGKRSDHEINAILEQVDFHPLSITLLATVAYQNKWNIHRLAKKWKSRRKGVLRTDHERGLADAIELLLASPIFQGLGPDARAVLEVIAFFPKGVDDNNLDWLFPTISSGKDILGGFCVLSLTYRSNGFTTMLAPLQDHFRPKDPKSSSLLCAIKERYFSRLSVEAHPDKPGFEETRWITSEDVNVEHLLDVFTSADASSNEVWDACANFMLHLKQHKPRVVILGPKVERLPDNHPFKPQCLVAFAKLLYPVGNYAWNKQLLAHALNLWRERGDDHQVARTLVPLAGTNMTLRLRKEGILQLREALEINERLNNTAEQEYPLQLLAVLLAKEGQFDAAEEVASRIINLSSGEPSQYQLSWYHHALGRICDARGEKETSIFHHEKAVGIATSLNLRDEQISFLRCFVGTLLSYERADDAEVYLERLKSNGSIDPFSMGLAATVQSHILARQDRWREAQSEVSSTVGVYKKIGALGSLSGPLERFLEHPIPSGPPK